MYALCAKSDVDMNVMSGDVACWCVVLGTLIGVLVYIVWLSLRGSEEP